MQNARDIPQHLDFAGLKFHGCFRERGCPIATLNLRITPHHVSTTFEQPKHLSVFSYQQQVRIFWPVFLPFGFLLSGVWVIGLWLRFIAGEQVAAWQWICAAGVGFLQVGLLRFGFFCERSFRRYLEFRERGLFLTGRGVITMRRFVTWSLSLDRIEPRNTRLQLLYKSGLGRRRWSMLLDDDRQISELRHALTLLIPAKDAA